MLGLATGKRTSVAAFALAALSLASLAGCSTASSVTAMTTRSPSRSMAASATPSPNAPAPSATTTGFAIVIGPGTKRLARTDAGPALFARYPQLRTAIEASLGAGVSADGLACTIGAVHVIGATAKGADVRVFGDRVDRSYRLDGWQSVGLGGGYMPVTIRLHRSSDDFRVVGIEQPADGGGYSDSLKAMMPGWASSRVGGYDFQKLLDSVLARWEAGHLPADAFVDQVPSVQRDPHHHVPAAARFRMLAPEYVGMSISEIATPSPDDLDHGSQFASSDHRFRLAFLLVGRMQVAIHDVVSRRWYAVKAPGEPDLAVEGAVSCDPAWRAHHLFIDYATDQDPYRPTVTHYEVDFDTLKVVRAVPMGPLSLNPVQGQK